MLKTFFISLIKLTKNLICSKGFYIFDSESINNEISVVYGKPVVF
jgi:hypothetical protein